MSEEVISITYYDIDEKREITIKCDPTALCESQPFESSRQKENHTIIKKDIEFQLIDLPNALREHGRKYTGHPWEKAAKMQEKWFSLPAREMSEREKGAKEIVPADYVLENYYSLEWLENANSTSIFREKLNILLYGKYDEMIGQYVRDVPSCIFNFKAKEKLREIFMKRELYHSYTDGREYLSVNRIQKFHQDFQFQKIDIFDKVDKLKLVLSFNALNDEFFATVAGCQLNAAVGKFKIEGNKVNITSVYIYIRDTFDFINSGDDQYLGHWNKFGFDVFYNHHLFSNFNQIEDKSEMLKNDIESLIPVNILATKADSLFYSEPKDRYFPVRNSTYNKWREKHKKGGDLLIFSELKEFPCDITVYL